MAVRVSLREKLGELNHCAHFVGAPHRLVELVAVDTPEAFTPVMQAFPELRIVMAHLGGGSWRQLPEFAEAHPSAYYDLCEIIEWTGAPRAPTDLDLAKLILKVGVEKVLMGSDFPWYSILHTVEKVNELPILTDEQKSLILGGNALEFLV